MPVVPRPESLHWLFSRHGQMVSCDLYLLDPARAVVEVAYLWDGGPKIVQRFAQPMAAVRRHAEIAGFLHHSGWLIAGRSILSRPGLTA